MVSNNLNKKSVGTSTATVLAISKDGKTARVSMQRTARHGKYHKLLNLSTVVLAHVSDDYKVSQGSKVEIIPCRKISTKKAWKVVSASSDAGGIS